MPAIRIDTARGVGVKNQQDSEISDMELNWQKQIPRAFPNVKQRSAPTPRYNCHGLTFASRRSKIYSATEIEKILQHDDYVQVGEAEVLPGDIVVYVDLDGEANHSGVVVESGPDVLTPRIVSKWGNSGEYIHNLNDCPAMYGPNIIFYRCKCG